MPSNPTSPFMEEVEKRNDILFYSCIAAIVGLAIFFRSQGYFDGNINFWWDEADWAHRLLTKPLSEIIKIRPVGYMFLTKLLVTHISRDETVFRLVSYIASLLSIPLVFLIARRLWNSKVIILLLLFITAFNPSLISFAKEFKPYALDFFVHSCLICLALIYIESRKNSILYVILAFSLISVFFCYNIVFIFPAIFFILLLEAYTNKYYRRLALLITVALVICLTLFFMYKFIWSGMNFAQEDKYWGSKYDVFFLGSNFLGHLKWLAWKYAGLVKDSGRAEIFWSGLTGLTPVVGLLLLFFHGTGILGFILERKFNYLILFFLPIITVILINSIGMWPFGPFRVNLFLMIYFVVLTVNGFYYFLKSRNKIIKYSLYCIVSAFFLLQLPINFHHYTIKPRDTWDAAQSDVLRSLEAIIKVEGAKRARGFVNWETVHVYADNHAYFSTQFYLTLHPKAVDFTKELQKLNVRYSYVLSGVEAFQPKGAYNILQVLGGLTSKPEIFQGVTWYVLGSPAAIDKIEPIIDSMPERILYKKKFSYASLVVLLRM